MISNFMPDPYQALDRLPEIASQARNLAQECEGDAIALLALLRKLEILHKEIRDEYFLAALPENRHDLYALLKDIESHGGWPYIERMRLRWFMQKLLEIEESEDGNGNSPYLDGNTPRS